MLKFDSTTIKKLVLIPGAPEFLILLFSPLKKKEKKKYKGRGSVVVQNEVNHAVIHLS